MGWWGLLTVLGALFLFWASWIPLESLGKTEH